ncbi:hypothetical protein BaRGS_00011640 [Batillaria attramentaria]|uniref:Uncharacterized protein n=1 Tax=Batillaria attramentaria TaxID=370345 RepID=A0ABD0LCS1_9CAEN
MQSLSCVYSDVTACPFSESLLMSNKNGTSEALSDLMANFRLMQNSGVARRGQRSVKLMPDCYEAEYCPMDPLSIQLKVSISGFHFISVLCTFISCFWSRLLGFSVLPWLRERQSSFEGEV